MTDPHDTALELLRQMLGARLSSEPPPILLSLPVAHAIPSVVGQIKAILETHPGPIPVHLRLMNGTVSKTTMQLTMTVDEEARRHLRVVIGQWAVVE